MCHDKQLIAILSAKYSPEKIEFIAGLIYSRSVQSAFDMAHNANKFKALRRRYRHQDSQPQRFIYGENPYIFARIVSNLTVEADEVRRMEYVRWTEPPYLKIETPGGLPVEREPATEKTLERAMNPLSGEIYG